MDATTHGRIDCLIYLSDNGLNLNSSNHEGVPIQSIFTMLYSMFCSENFIESQDILKANRKRCALVLAVMLDKGLENNGFMHEGRSLLDWAYFFGDTNITDLLLKNR